MLTMQASVGVYLLAATAVYVLPYSQIFFLFNSLIIFFPVLLKIIISIWTQTKNSKTMTESEWLLCHFSKTFIFRGWLVNLLWLSDHIKTSQAG